MATPEMIHVLARLAAGALACFAAILLWAKTRDTAWMLVIVGVIIAYGAIVYDTLKRFGVVPGSVFVLPETLSIDTLLAILPLLFFGAAFVVKLAAQRSE
jgi:hypothetical protein